MRFPPHVYVTPAPGIAKILNPSESTIYVSDFLSVLVEYIISVVRDRRAVVVIADVRAGRSDRANLLALVKQILCHLNRGDWSAWLGALMLVGCLDAIEAMLRLSKPTGPGRFLRLSSGSRVPAALEPWLP
jgi:hypothetical protein